MLKNLWKLSLSCWTISKKFLAAEKIKNNFIDPVISNIEKNLWNRSWVIAVSNKILPKMLVLIKMQNKIDSNKLFKMLPKAKMKSIGQNLIKKYKTQRLIPFQPL